MNPATPVTTTLKLSQPYPETEMSRFEAWLADSGVGISVKQFPEGTRTAVDAANAIGCEVGQIVKSLVFVAAGKPVVALVSGANRLDEGRLGSGPGTTAAQTPPG